MGTTLANLHIHGISVEEVEKLVPDSLAVQFAPEWVTITSEYFSVGNMDKIAQKLSRKIENPVLLAEVFDSDLLILNIYRDGKNVAKHISGSEYGYLKKLGNPTAFVKELELPENYVEYIKWILNCEDLGKKIQLLEKTLGIPLWIDYRMVPDSKADNNIIHQDIDYVEDYIKEKRALEKIKNVTKAKLLIEFDGKSYEELGSDMYHIQRPCSDGNYHEFREHFIYGISSKGILEPLFDISSFNANYHNRHIETNKKVVAMLESVPYGVIKDRISFLLFDLKGKLLGETELPREAGYPLLVFEDDGIICSTYGPAHVIAEYGIDGLKKWELEVGYLNINPIFHEGYIYLYYTKLNKKKSELLKINRKGEILESLDLKLCGGAHWRTFLFDRKGNFYFCLRVNDNGAYFNKLFYINSNLNIISELILDDCSFEGVLDTGNNRLYISIFQKEFIVVDTEQNLIYTRRKCEESSNLRLTDIKGRLLVSKRNTVEVLDPELNIISRHRLKGIIIDSNRNSDGNVCFITSQMPGEAYTSDNVKSTLRVYEIL